MSKIKLLSLAVIGLLIVNLSTVGFLFLRKPPHTEGRPRPFERMRPKNKIIETLHLDSEQVAQFEKLIDQHKEKTRQLRDNIREVKSQLYQTLSEENASSRDSLISQLGVLQKEIEVVHYDHFAQIKKLCKPDQIEYFNSLTGELANFFSPEKDGAQPPR
jgi:periplasmic protein CpxP/Spy